MRSQVSADASRRRRDRLARMTPAERVALAFRMSERGLADYMASQRLDRRTARAAIEATRRAGRRRSASAERR